jgi:carboxylesterase type B
MQGYWSNLATSGVPSATGAPVWTRYEAGRDNHLILDSAGLAMGDGVNTARCDFWSALGV